MSYYQTIKSFIDDENEEGIACLGVGTTFNQVIDYVTIPERGVMK